MSLEGKTAVITGASSGIGAAVARMLHERGVKLGLASRRGADLGLPGTMRAEDVAELVLFALERPRPLRILETALRPMSEGSWG